MWWGKKDTCNCWCSDARKWRCEYDSMTDSSVLFHCSACDTSVCETCRILSFWHTSMSTAAAAVKQQSLLHCSRERCSVSPCGEILCSSSYSSKDTLSAPNPLLLSNANAFNSELYFLVILSQWFDMTSLFSLQMLRPHTLISANTLYYAIRQFLTSHHIHIAVAVGTCL